MSHRLRSWLVVALLALVTIVALALHRLPYLPLLHGTTSDEIERLVALLDVRPGMRIADIGAGDGTFSLALARRVGPCGSVYATEIDDKLLADIRHKAAQAGLANITAVAGEVVTTGLPEGCCDAIFSRLVYHHLTQPAAINADLLRALRPGGRLLILDFPPGTLLDWIGRSGTEERHGGHGTPPATLTKEVTFAGFELVRGPEPWRGRVYAMLFKRP